MYNPLKCYKQSADRLIRWGIELRDFNYIIHHIPDELNHWADLISRSGGETEPVRHVRALRVSDEQHDDSTQNLANDYRVHPLLNIVWPHTSEIAKEQARVFIFLTAVWRGTQKDFWLTPTTEC
jgi:hypothetical protein